MSWQIADKKQSFLFSKNYQIKLIINADDFGHSSYRDRGILQLIKNKKVTSISVIINGTNIKNGVQNLKQILSKSIMKEELSIGLHFNLTEGYPITKSFCNIPLIKNNMFLGKKQFYNLISDKKQTQIQVQTQQFIKIQFRAQIMKFIQIFNTRPSHIDGHNHIHIIPLISELICPIMSQYGIYKSRLPIQQLINQSHQFNHVFIENAKDSQLIFQKNLIEYPERFIGLEQIGKLDLQHIIQKSLNFKTQHNKFVELMCHPGYLDPFQGDQFNRSHQRQIQMKSLKQFQFQKYESNIKLSNFNFLTSAKIHEERKRILIYSKMNVGSGNWTSSLRLKQILQNLGYKVYLRSIEDQIQKQEEIQNMRSFLFNFGISLIIGVNLTRSAQIIYSSTRNISKQGISFTVPYILVIAGTDANSFFYKPQAKQLFLPLKNCFKLISMSFSMAEKTKQFLQKINILDKKIQIISQSSNISRFEVESQQELQKIYEYLNKCYKIDLKVQQNKFILFPTSFRKVKDIQHLLKAFNFIIDKYQIRVFIAGPILNLPYYDQCKKKLKKVQYIGILQKKIYLQLLKKCLFVVNTSINEGMSCSINESLELGKICVVRKNQGNCQMIKNQENGFVYVNQQNFISIFQLIYQNKLNFLQKIKLQAKKSHIQKYSYNIEVSRIQKVIESLFQIKRQILSFSQVHPISMVNLNLFEQIPIQMVQNWILKNNLSRIIDLGCGTGVFLLSLIKKMKVNILEQLNLQFYDVSEQILSNCLYNIRQSVVFDNIKSIKLIVSNMFANIQQPQNNNIWLANLPQTPFKFESSKIDKNGGRDSLKFNESMIRKFSQFGKKSLLIMLYSYMADPNKFFQLIKDLQLEILWKSDKLIHQIKKQSYDQMEDGLSQFIKQHIKQKKAQVIVQNDVFFVPAQVLILKRKQ